MYYQRVILNAFREKMQGISATKNCEDYHEPRLGGMVTLTKKYYSLVTIIG
jgi:hypothetical protein